MKNFTKFIFALLAFCCIAGVQSVNAATEKVYANLNKAGTTTNTSWDATMNKFKWYNGSWNELNNLGLPKGDITKYKKLVIDCEILSGDQLRVYFRRTDAGGGGQDIIYINSGTTTLDFAELVSTDQLKQNSLLYCKDIIVCGNNKWEVVGTEKVEGEVSYNGGDSIRNVYGEAIINKIYLEGLDLGYAYSLDLSSTEENQIPAGWKALDGKTDGNITINEYPNGYGSGPRTFVGFTGYQGKGFYWRSSYQNDLGWAVFGMQKDYPLTLNEGKYCLNYAVAAWKGEPKFKVSIAKKNGEEIGETIATSEEHIATPNAEGNRTANLSATQLRQLEFNINETGDYIIKFYATRDNCEFLLLDCNILDGQLIVTDGEDFNPTFSAYAGATYSRTVNPEYNYGTICLPFAPDAATCENYTFYKLDQASANTLMFVEEKAPEANTAYLYRPKDASATTHAFTGGETKVSTEVAATTSGDWSFIGSLKNATIDLTADGSFYAYKPDANNGENKISKATKSMSVKPYRAYFHYTGKGKAVATMRVIVRGDGTTGIEEVITPDQIESVAPTTIYNLMGQPVAQPVKGQIYIVNGKKVVY